MNKDNSNRLQIGILLICTGKYGTFLQPLIDGLNTNFFINEDITIFLFSDRETYHLSLNKRFSIVHIPIEHKPWPYSTLFRYKYFTQAAKHIKRTDYCFYSDVDMAFVGKVDREILSEITVTRHPGFYNNGNEWGSPNCHERSTAFLPERNRKSYFAGGFNGGKTEHFLEMSRILDINIDTDEDNSILAQHNDETHLNWFINTRANGFLVKELTPSYCMIPDIEVRNKYGLGHLEPKIIALDKNHAEMRAD